MDDRKISELSDSNFSDNAFDAEFPAPVNSEPNKAQTENSEPNKTQTVNSEPNKTQTADYEPNKAQTANSETIIPHSSFLIPHFEEPEFRLPERPPVNYRSVLNIRNAEQIRRDMENPPEELPPLYGFCGTDCRDCEYNIGANIVRGEDGIGCRGCRADGGDCDIRICCLSKSLENCGGCEEFPCDMLKKVSEEEDDENLFRLKKKYDEKTDRSEKLNFSYALGFTLGVTVGALLGAITGLSPQMMICGIAIGLAIPAIANIGR